MNNIHYKFGFSPIDKANSNVLYICQRIYGLVLIKKLSLDQNATSENETYVHVSKRNNQVIPDNPKILKNEFNLEQGTERRNSVTSTEPQSLIKTLLWPGL